MRLLSVITSLNPAHGGPVECALQLQRNLTNLGHEFDIVTLDRPDAVWNRNLAFKPICLGKHDDRRIEPALIKFLKIGQREYDGSVFHGIWTFPNVALRACWDRQHRYVVFPHGMLDPYFIKNFPFKHIKKASYYRLIAAPVLKRAHAVLFTCEEERRLAKTGYRPVVGRRLVVRYGIDRPSVDSSLYQGRLLVLKEQLADKDVVLFLGRIHPKKGCDLLIRAMSSMASKYPDLHLVMAGPDEVGLIEKLKDQARQGGVADRISWAGPVYGEEKWFLYHLANAFILPSHMENFGMTVAEALSQGVPVLLSNKVNIFSSIVQQEAGLSAPDTLAGTTSLFERWVKTSREMRLSMSANSRRLFENEFQAVYTATDVISVFSDKSSNRVDAFAPALAEE
jgi:glycosyltransferase involved in cell wall biosynthesis